MTFQVMQALISQAFLNVETISEAVNNGHYDICGPEGSIILPDVWEVTARPGWKVEMKMWPPDPNLSRRFHAGPHHPHHSELVAHLLGARSRQIGIRLLQIDRIGFMRRTDVMWTTREWETKLKSRPNNASSCDVRFREV